MAGAHHGSGAPRPWPELQWEELGEDAARLHTIWGPLEGGSTSETSQHSNSASGSHSGSEKRQRSPPVMERPAKSTGSDAPADPPLEDTEERRVRRLPADVRRYLPQITRVNAAYSQGTITPDDDSGQSSLGSGGGVDSGGVWTASANQDMRVQDDRRAQEESSLLEGRCAEEGEDEESKRESEAAGSEEPATAAWSLGSTNHAAGACRPCHYVHTPLGCVNGQECAFCHLSHTKKVRPRPCKTKRAQCQRYAQMLDSGGSSEQILDSIVENKLLQSARGKYLQGLLRKKLEEHRQGGEEDEEAESSDDPILIEATSAQVPVRVGAQGPASLPQSSGLPLPIAAVASSAAACLQAPARGSPRSARSMSDSSSSGRSAGEQGDGCSEGRDIVSL